MKTKLFAVLLLLLVGGISMNVFAQDLIILRTGDEIQAIVNEVDLNVIKYKKFENQTGPTYIVDKSTVFMIKYKNGTKDVFTMKTEVKKENPVVNQPQAEQVQPATSIQSPTPSESPTKVIPVAVTDFDGNSYKTVTIGNQVWMAENLKTTHFNNGDPIPNIVDNGWSTQKSAAMCFYENDLTNKDLYGGLYNWYAMNDSRNICPTGWHIPTEADWTTLIDFLGGEELAGGKLKESGTMHWADPNQGATNESGFAALPGGGRYDIGKFDLKGYFGLWGTSPENDSNRVWYRSLDWNSSKILNHHDGSKGGAGSIRCVRNKPAEQIVANVNSANMPVISVSAEITNSQTGMLKIFSELSGVKVYIDEKVQGINVTQISGVPVGSHYVKVLYDNVIVYGEVIEIKAGATTTILVKNSGQIQEKLLNSKIKEQQEYKNNKLDIILSRGSSTSTKGYNNIFPGYYGYWGISNSTSTTVETTDWKIIQGGVKEISERTFATLTNNTALQARIDKEWKNYNSVIGTTAIIGLATLIPSMVILYDMMNSNTTDKPSFLFENTPDKKAISSKGQDAQIGWFVGCALPCFLSCTICLKYKEPSGHHISVENAANESQLYNNQLKKKLGLPVYFDVK